MKDAIIACRNAWKKVIRHWETSYEQQFGHKPTLDDKETKRQWCVAPRPLAPCLHHAWPWRVSSDADPVVLLHVWRAAGTRPTRRWPSSPRFSPRRHRRDGDEDLASGTE